MCVNTHQCIGNGTSDEYNSQFAIVLLFDSYTQHIILVSSSIVDGPMENGNTQSETCSKYPNNNGIHSFQFNCIDLLVYILYTVFSESPHPIFLLSIPSSWSELNIIILKRKYAFTQSR